jgi:hypothetical protein
MIGESVAFSMSTPSQFSDRISALSVAVWGNS